MLSALLAERNIQPVDPNARGAQAGSVEGIRAELLVLALDLVGHCPDGFGWLHGVHRRGGERSQPAGVAGFPLHHHGLDVRLGRVDLQRRVPRQCGSRWEERWLRGEMLEDAGVPKSIAATARTLLADAPGLNVDPWRAGAGIGPRLYPDLLLVRNGEHVCIGVWDDTGIIALAA